MSELTVLHDKYKNILDIWLNKHNNDHKLYYPFLNLKNALNEGIPGMSPETLETIKSSLIKFFPDERFFPRISIELSSDSDDDNYNGEPVFEVPQPTVSLPATIDVSSLMNDDDENLQQPQKLPESSVIQTPVQKSNQKRPQKSLGSIAEYKTKSLIRFRPSSSYAKPSENENNRTTLTVPYKTPIAPKPSFDPKEEAEKLSMIKEKIYLEKYIKIDQTRKEEIMVSHCSKLMKTNTDHPLDLKTTACPKLNEFVEIVSNLCKVDKNAKLIVVPAKEKRRRRKTCFFEKAPKGILKERRSSLSIDTNNNNLVDIGNKRDSLRLRKDKVSYNESTEDDDEIEKVQVEEQKEQKLRKPVKRVRFAELPDDAEEST